MKFSLKSRGKKEKVQLVGFSVNGCSSSPLSKSFSPSASDLLLECQQGHARGRSRVSRGGPRRNLGQGSEGTSWLDICLNIWLDIPYTMNRLGNCCVRVSVFG